MDKTESIRPYSEHFTRRFDAVEEDLEQYEKLLRKWQTIQNLVSRETLNQTWQRHFADSLQILPLLRETDTRFLDLGSGGGLPAIPLAIASKGSGRQFTLLEPNGRKASFLRTVARELELPMTIDNRRAEDIDSRETRVFDVITSRALAPLTTLCTWMQPYFAPSTRAILHKGREHVHEIAESVLFWDMDVLLTKSDTDSSGVLLTLTNLHVKSAQ